MAESGFLRIPDFEFERDMAESGFLRIPDFQFQMDIPESGFLISKSWFHCTGDSLFWDSHCGGPSGVPPGNPDCLLGPPEPIENVAQTVHFHNQES